MGPHKQRKGDTTKPEIAIEARESSQQQTSTNGYWCIAHIQLFRYFCQLFGTKNGQWCSHPYTVPPSEVPAIINLARLIGSTTRFGALGGIWYKKDQNEEFFFVGRYFGKPLNFVTQCCQQLEVLWRLHVRTPSVDWLLLVSLETPRLTKTCWNLIL